MIGLYVCLELGCVYPQREKGVYTSEFCGFLFQLTILGSPFLI